jgi:NodT family efflux transporter outer membrane factor (OMF) lipoprotein
MILFLPGFGCKVGPNYHPPATSMPATWGEAPAVLSEPPTAPSESPASRATTQPAELAEWWKTFRDPVLDGLIGEAIRGNLDLRQAQARVREARAKRGIVAAGEWPLVGAIGSYKRERLSRNASVTGQTVAALGGYSNSGINLYQAGFDASWELDVWGKVQREVEAADANIAAAVEDRRDVLVTLLSEVALNYVELRSFQRQKRIAQDTLDAQHQTVELTRAQYEIGTTTELDVAQAQAQEANFAAQIPVLETSIRQRIHQLGVLIGQQPMVLSQLEAQESPIPPTPVEIPVGLPSDLLRQRADVRRAERQLAASTAQIGVAVADLFPQFSLTGGLGLQSTNLNTLAKSGSLYWNAGPSITWPIFDGGAIRSNIKVTNAVQEQAATAYEQAVLTALRETEDALVAFFKEQARRKALAEAVEADRRALELATELFKNGRTDFLNVLVAQQTLYAAEIALAQSDQALATDLVTLYKALGGGWESVPLEETVSK